MQTYKHRCISNGCAVSYDSSDPEPYLCAVHLEERKAIALEVDKKFAGRKLEQKPSLYQQYDAATTGAGRRFPTANELMNM